MIGTRIAHYEITAKLGEGEMVVVYKARERAATRSEILDRVRVAGGAVGVEFADHAAHGRYVE